MYIYKHIYMYVYIYNTYINSQKYWQCANIPSRLLLISQWPVRLMVSVTTYNGKYNRTSCAKKHGLP